MNARLKAALQRLQTWHGRPDVLVSEGALIVALGAGMIYRPAGVILAGLSLIAGGVIRAATDAKAKAAADARSS